MTLGYLSIGKQVLRIIDYLVLNVSRDDFKLNLELLIPPKHLRRKKWLSRKQQQDLSRIRSNQEHPPRPQVRVETEMSRQDLMDQTQSLDHTGLRR